MSICEDIAKALPEYCRAPYQVMPHLSNHGDYQEGGIYEIGAYMLAVKRLMLTDMLNEFVSSRASLTMDLAVFPDMERDGRRAQYDSLGRLHILDRWRDHSVDAAYSFNEQPIIIEWITGGMGKKSNLRRYLFTDKLKKRRKHFKKFIPDMKHIVFVFEDIFHQIEEEGYASKLMEEEVVLASIYGEKYLFRKELKTALRENGFLFDLKNSGTSNQKMLWSLPSF